MPLIDFSLREGSLEPDRLEWLMPRLTKTLMYWEKMPDSPSGRARTQLWVHEFPADRTLVGGSGEHRPYYRIDVKIPANRLGELDRAGIVRDFTTLILTAEGSPVNSVEAARVWVLIRDVPTDSWGVSGHRDWMRDYESGLDQIRATPADLGTAELTEARDIG
jgi:phenylpyruvate tautomerase PptA (4-oxalocrotonate tautomerase family)